MKKILRRTGLLDSFEIELKMPALDFINGLTKKVDKNEFHLADIFRNDKKEYWGIITEKKFELQKWKKSIFSMGPLSKASGEMKKQDNHLIISVEITSIRPYSTLIGVSLSLLFFFIIGIGVLITGILEEKYIIGLLGILGVWAFSLIPIGLPLTIMKWSVQNLKGDIEYELKSIEKKYKQQQRNLY